MHGHMQHHSSVWNCDPVSMTIAVSLTLVALSFWFLFLMIAAA